jgi:polyisoprenoid-binding protein YceI
MRKTPLFLALGLALAAAAPLAATTYTFDKAHTEIGFEVTHLGVSKVRGHFTDNTATITLDDADLTKSTVEISIPVASVSTGQPKRDADLQGEDFFGAEKNPNITFKSTKVVKTADGYDLTGDFTIHGVTKPLTLKAKISDVFDGGWGMTKRGFSLRGSINRFDYGVVWGAKTPGGTLVVSETVDLVIDGELLQPGKGGPKGGHKSGDKDMKDKK